MYASDDDTRETAAVATWSMPGAITLRFESINDDDDDDIVEEQQEDRERHGAFLWPVQE